VRSFDQPFGWISVTSAGSVLAFVGTAIGIRIARSAAAAALAGLIGSAVPVVTVCGAVAVVVDAVDANLRGTRVDRGISVVAVVADGKPVLVAVLRRSAI
jgi:hypothetical protein